MEARVHNDLYEVDEKAMAFSCWTGQASSFWALRKACCRSLLLIGCRFKCFWGSPHRPPGPGAMFGQRDRWAAFHSLYTLSSPHTLLYIHKLFCFLCNAFHGTYVLLACTLCNIKRKVFFYNFAWNSIVLLEAWNEGLVLVMHFMFTWLHCILVALHLHYVQAPSCTGAMFWLSIACNKYWILQGILL